MVIKMHSKSLCFYCEPYDSDIHRKIEYGIISNEFLKKSIYGFRIHSRRENYLYASYIEKKKLVEKITDPFGVVTEFKRITYQQIDFQIKKEPPQIIIFNPGNSYRKLINQIAQLADYSIAIENKSIDLIGWGKFIFKYGLKGRISNVYIDKIIYNNYTIGKLFLSSSKDIEKMINLLMGEKKHLIKKIKINFTDIKNFASVELYSNGRIAFPLEVENKYFDIFYEIFNNLNNLEN